MSRSVSAPSSVTNTSPCWNGLIVPGSTLMYGSNFWIVTDSPRDTSSWPIEAAAMPLPRAETTPPVTKMKRVSGRSWGIQLSGNSTIAAPAAAAIRGWPSCGRQKLLGVPARAGVGGLCAQHPAQFRDHGVAVERLDARDGQLA